MGLDDYLIKLLDKDTVYFCIQETGIGDITVRLNDLVIKLNHKTKDFKNSLGQIRYVLQDKFIIAWNIKDFISFVLKHTKNLFKLDNVVDLKIAENYLKLSSEKYPDNLLQAQIRLSKCFKSNSWNSFKSANSNVYSPLSLNILPNIENTGVLDRRVGRYVYPYYEVEGQLNGRLKCLSSNGVNPHTLSDEDKQNLYLPDNNLFVYCDYRSMEVAVLQWLSGDKALEKILLSGNDIYNTIWKELTGLDGNDAYRKLCKSIFLPVMFGQGVAALSERSGLDIGKSELLISRINKVFEVAVNWIKGQQENIVDNIAIDFFGRLRKFESNEVYKVRNFSVQSPAALVCLHKLVQLYDNLNNSSKVLFHIHDGYVLSCNQLNVKDTIIYIKDILQKDNNFYENLHLTCDVKLGKNLYELE